MKNYIKPDINLIRIVSEGKLALSGLSDWLIGNDLQADINITTFEYIS